MGFSPSTDSMLIVLLSFYSLLHPSLVDWEETVNDSQDS